MDRRGIEYFIALVAIGASAHLASPAHAQDDSRTSELVEPTGDAGFSVVSEGEGLSSNLLLESASDAKDASARIEWRRNNLTWNAKLTAPLSKSGETKLASLDGLAKGARLDVRMQLSLWNPEADARKQTAICRRFLVEEYKCEVDKLPKDRQTQLKEKLDELCKAQNLATCNPDALTGESEKAYEQKKSQLCEADKDYLRDEANEAELSKRMICVGGNLSRRPDLLAEFDGVADWGTAWALGIRGRVARQDFAYADPMTYAPQNAKRTAKSLALSVGGIFQDVIFASLTYEYQRSYKAGSAGPKVERCRPIDMNGNLECNELPLGEPTQSDQHLFRLELRRFVTENLAIAFRATKSKDVFGFEVPIYFLQDKKKGLAGGVTVGFRSDEEEPLITVFVANSFSFASLN